MSKKQNSQFIDYQIDDNEYIDGGYCQFYNIDDISGFKEFKNKRKAHYARSVQKHLSRYNLAPIVMSKVCRLNFANIDQNTEWGYITEKATNVEYGEVSLDIIQKLVDDIYKYCGLKFWDCHYDNIGWVKRKNSLKLVCIDTGKESFDGLANAWGFSDPGPKCGYCNRYQCRCSEY